VLYVFGVKCEVGRRVTTHNVKTKGQAYKSE